MQRAVPDGATARRCAAVSQPHRPVPVQCSRRRRLGVTNVARGAPAQLQQQPPPRQQPQASQGGGPGKQPPRPPELPLFGHALSMLQFLLTRGTVEDLLMEWRRQLGPVYEWQVPGSPPVVVVTDPEAIKEVYEVLNYAKSPRYSDLLPLLGAQSMITAEGHAWRMQRDAFTPGFSSAFLKSALPGFVEATDRLVLCLGAAADTGDVVRLHHVTVLTTLEIICKVGFGESVDFLGAGLQGPLWRAFEGLGRHIAWFLDNIPLNWAKHLPWNRAKTAALQERLDAQLMAILQKRLREMGMDASGQPQKQQQQLLRADAAASSSSSSASGGKCPFPGVGSLSAAAAAAAAGAPADAAVAGTAAAADEQSLDGGSAACPFSASTEQLMQDSKDILSLAVKLSMQAAAGGSSSSSSSSGLDLDVLLSQMKTFFAAGHDTTASLVGWTIWYLSRHPEAEAALVDEVTRVLGSDDRPSYEQLSEMRFLNAVLKESLRVRPPVGVLARFSPAGSAPLRGYDTGGKVLLVSPFVQHQDTDAWGPDAAEFKPQRWLEADGRAQHVHAYSYMPFSRGQRDCIGARFALLEAKTILAMLYRNFDFCYAGKQPEEVMVSITVHPKFGVPCRVTWRRDAPARRRVQAAETAAAGAARS